MSKSRVLAFKLRIKLFVPPPPAPVIKTLRFITTTFRVADTPKRLSGRQIV